MADSVSPERLQPSLLDRLTDKRPNERTESNDERVLSPAALRKAIIRDLEWLLNTGNYESSRDLSDYEHVRRSVINFGVPEISGSLLSNIDVQRLERAITQAIWDFEPRILRQTLRVQASRNDEEMSRNAIVFQIEAQAWGQPQPLHFVLRTEMDLESGQVSIVDFGG